jgi:hypothetical protein
MKHAPELFLHEKHKPVLQLHFNFEPYSDGFVSNIKRFAPEALNPRPIYVFRPTNVHILY